MNKEDYITNLKLELINQKRGKYYSKRCLLYAERLLDNNLPVIFDIKHLSLLLGIGAYHLGSYILTTESYFYKKISIPKRNGSMRVLQVPSAELKYIQRWILDNILNNIHISDHANGFCRGKSIVTNAKAHVGKECIINLDIKDFFPSIDIDTVFRIFSYYGYTKEVSFALARLCTYEGCLPQGSPASPLISNIVCLKMDKRISSLVAKYNASYTRYADDITISGRYSIQDCIRLIEEIIVSEGFEVNTSKKRILYKHQRQVVTGLNVNQGRLSVPKKFKRALRQEIYYCKRFGISEHLRRIACDKAFYKEHLYGKAYYINMVEPEEGKKVLSLLDSLIWDY